MNVAFKAA